MIDVEEMRDQLERLRRRVMEMEAALPQAEEEARKQEVANAKALELLRQHGPNAERLADGEIASIPSLTFPGIVYVISPDFRDAIVVCHSLLGRLGTLCIREREPAPPADVLLSKFLLCQRDERQLWSTGNYCYESGQRFLPKQIQMWMGEGRKRAEPQRANRVADITEGQPGLLHLSIDMATHPPVGGTRSL